MSNKNYQIAKFYTHLYELKEIISNEIIPSGTHIGILEKNYELADGLDSLVSLIDEHMERFKLSEIDLYPPKN